jgi:hypothetical protein
VTEMAFAGLTASTHPAAASAAQSFAFMAVTPLWTDRRSRHQHRSYRVPSSIIRRVLFFGQPDMAGPVCVMPVSMVARVGNLERMQHG